MAARTSGNGRPSTKAANGRSNRVPASRRASARSGTAGAPTAPSGDSVPGGLRGFLERRTGDWSVEGPDRTFVHRQQRLWNLVTDHYFRMEVHGWHRVPSDPALFVGTHASGTLPMDAWTLCFEWIRRYGERRILHGTVHDGLFALPGVGEYLKRLGALPAGPEPVSAAFAAGHDVIVWPGGDLDALRPWTQRDRVVLGGRDGFVRQAIRSGVPIVPVATVGGSDTLIVISDGRRLARALRLKRLLRSEVFPITFGVPLGIFQGMLPALPMPAKLRTELLEPVEVDDDPDRADDNQYVRTKYHEVERKIQAGVDRLAKRRSFPIFG